MKSEKVTLSVSVLVDAPAAQVFERLTDWPAQAEWMVGTSVRATKQSGIGVNATLSAFTGIGPIGFADTMVITAWDPPHRCSVRHTGHIVTGTGDFIVTEISEQQSRFEWSESFVPPLGLVGRFVWPVLQPFVRFGLLLSLQRFARWSTA